MATFIMWVEEKYPEEDGQNETKQLERYSFMDLMGKETFKK